MIGIQLRFKIKIYLFICMFISGTNTIYCDPDIGIDIVSIYFTKKSFFLQYRVTNNTNQVYWLQKSGGMYLCRDNGNLILFAPVYNYYKTKWEGTGVQGNMEVKTVRLNPHEDVLMEFNDTLKEESFVRSSESIISDHDYSDTEFINITLVFLEKDILNPIIPRVYTNILIKEGIFICKMLRTKLR